MTDKQKAFLERNKYRKNIGNCVICKKPTSWNEEKGRYDRFCSDACVKKYVEIRNKRVLELHQGRDLRERYAKYFRVYTIWKISYLLALCSGLFFISMSNQSWCLE